MYPSKFVSCIKEKIGFRSSLPVMIKWKCIGRSLPVFKVLWVTPEGKQSCRLKVTKAIPLPSWSQDHFSLLDLVTHVLWRMFLLASRHIPLCNLSHLYYNNKGLWKFCNCIYICLSLNVCIFVNCAGIFAGTSGNDEPFPNDTLVSDSFFSYCFYFARKYRHSFKTRYTLRKTYSLVTSIKIRDDET